MNTESIIAEYADTILEDEDLHTNDIATNIDYRANECDVDIENLVEKYSKLDINSKYLDSFNITMDENRDVATYIDLLQNYNKIFEENKVLRKELLEREEEIQMLRDEVTQRKNEIKVMKKREESIREDENDRIKKDENNQKILLHNQKQIKKQRKDHNNLKKEFDKLKEFVYLSKEEEQVKRDSVTSALIENNDENFPISDINSIDENPPIIPATPLENIPNIAPVLQNTSSIQNIIVNDSLKVVPGHKTYSNCHKKTTLIVGDSMIGRLTAHQIRKEIQTENENIIINRHPGASADELQHYVTYQLNTLKPEKIIIVAGTNDVLRDKKDGSLNKIEIANRIINMGLKAKSTGTKNIFISGILTMTGTYMRNVINRVNNLLEERCFKEGFIFIDNSDITVAHLSKDGIHPNYYGFIILKMNILKCFPCFNPYICDFLDIYENALY